MPPDRKFVQYMHSIFRDKPTLRPLRLSLISRDAVSFPNCRSTYPCHYSASVNTVRERGERLVGDSASQAYTLSLRTPCCYLIQGLFHQGPSIAFVVGSGGTTYMCLEHFLFTPSLSSGNVSHATQSSIRTSLCSISTLSRSTGLTDVRSMEVPNASSVSW